MKKITGLFDYDSKRTSESGNVLFLILIAVALFAALSYAVTQSTRSGAGSSDNETALINSAQITQYPAGVRTAVVRMIIGGTDVANIEFNPPSGFGDYTGGNTAIGVFHPKGGGATYVKAPAALMADGNAGTWYFNGDFEIENIGTTTAASPDGNEIIAFLPGVTSTLCSRMNQELGIGAATAFVADLSGSYGPTGTHMENPDGATSYIIPNEVLVIGAAAGDADLSGQPFGCFTNSDNERVYYHVLIER